MRTTKELLEVMLGNIDKLEGGLCTLAFDLSYAYGLFSMEELFVVAHYMQNNLPEKTFSWRYGETPRFSFPFDEKQPRIDWLKQQIEKLEQTK